MAKILCVAEKPSIAKAVTQHLSGGTFNSRSVTGSQYVKNYEFEYSFPPPWGHCNVTMTSVIGHLKTLDFEQNYRKWNSCRPGELFDAPVINYVDKDKLPIAKNIETQARFSKALLIWTDCDREGEHIGTEIREEALRGNSRLQVKRARFSNIERTHVINAARNPVDVDENQANAVAARIELDLRIGAALTRLQTLSLQKLGPELNETVLSYGSCQFPTLGFVVDRYFRVKNFIPESFWGIKVMHYRDGKDVSFSWSRYHLFDHMAVTIIFERCLTARTATVTKMDTRPTSKWRPVPLTTLELQKMATRYLRMDSQKAMSVAEELYTKGFISYPRTETDQFDKGMDLQKLVEKQVADSRWGSFARELINGGFNWPRSGPHNDQAHPPIHPVAYVAPNALGSDDHRRLYEFVVRHFLACCSEDARGNLTSVEILYGGEIFRASGLIVLARNYLDVYPYENWHSSQELPPFTPGEQFIPTSAEITAGKTGPPGYLTEPDLLALMDANGIGTDATMAEHISKIQERNYAMTQSRPGGDQGDDPSNRGGRGRGGRGRGRAGRGGGEAVSGRRGGNSTKIFIPTTLGVALIEGYEGVGFDTSLGKPFLRKEMELKMKDICAGSRTRHDVVHESLEQYREVFIRTQQQIETLKAACRKYVLGASS